MEEVIASYLGTFVFIMTAAKYLLKAIAFMGLKVGTVSMTAEFNELRFQAFC